MSEQKSIPSWAADPLLRLVDHLRATSDLLELSRRAIAHLAVTPTISQTLASALPSNSPAAGTPTHLFERLAKLASDEVDAQFPSLLAQSTLSLWADLEDSLRTFLATWFSRDSGALAIRQVQNVKIRLAEYEAMDPDERRFYLVERVLEDTELRRSYGVDRFESMFATLGFDTTLDEGVRRDLLELFHVRNLLAHRRGIVDRRFLRSCPWLSVSAKERFTVTPDRYSRYWVAVITYVKELVVRVAARFSIDRSETLTMMDKRIPPLGPPSPD